MKRFFKGMAAAFSMYSNIPVPQISWDDDCMKYALCFFPLVGAVIGAVEYLWILLSSCFSFGNIFRAAGMIIIPVIITGGIHLDGFLDTADALGSWRSREERLKILKDPRAGSFAVIWGIVYFLTAFGAASEISRRSIPVLCLMFMMSRCLSGLSVISFPKANSTGTAAGFSDKAGKKTVRIVLTVWFVCIAALAVWILPSAGFLMTAVCILSFLLYHHISIRYFGGMTGDIAGFFVCVTELAVPVLEALFVR